MATSHPTRKPGNRGELRPRSRRPPHGRRAGVFKIPIALKFAAFIAVLVVAFMAWQSYTAMRAAARSLEEEINRGGVTLAVALSAALDPGWVQRAENRDRLIKSLGEFSRFAGAGRILNVVVEDTKGPIATARAESTISRSSGTPLEDAAAAAAGVEIREFRYEGNSVRSFSRALQSGGPGGDRRSPIGRIEVYVSAAAIEQSRERLSSAMIKVAITACAVGAVGAFLLARYLTTPIRNLVKDMKIVSLGDLEHQSKVASNDELGDLARAFNMMTAGLHEAQEARVAQRAMEYELSLASSIQTRLLPSSTPQIAGYDVAVLYTPAKEVSGDYYDFVKTDEHHLGIVVADVSGKGVPAALVMTMTRSLLRLAARGESDPKRTVELVDRFLTPDLKRGMFVTLVYLVLAPETGEVILVRAGHNAPLLRTVREGKVARVMPQGIAVGLDPKGSLFCSQLKAQRLVLSAGDALVVYTDGVVEAKDAKDAEYTEERLIRVVRDNPGETSSGLLDAIEEDIARHRAGCDLSDDVTAVVLRRMKSG